MRKLVLAALATAALITAAAASAGGWATVGVTGQLPSSTDDTWNVTLTVLRHGETPTDGAAPSITIRNGDGTSQTFVAKPIGNGKYTASIRFPEPGTWRYTVNNGLAATGYGESAVQTFAPIEIRAGDGSSGSGDGSSFPASMTGAGIAVALGLALLYLVSRRRPLRGLPATTTH